LKGSPGENEKDAESVLESFRGLITAFEAKDSIGSCPFMLQITGQQWLWHGICSPLHGFGGFQRTVYSVRRGSGPRLGHEQGRGRVGELHFLEPFPRHNRVG